MWVVDESCSTRRVVARTCVQIHIHLTLAHAHTANLSLCIHRAQKKLATNHKVLSWLRGGGGSHGAQRCDFSFCQRCRVERETADQPYVDVAKHTRSNTSSWVNVVGTHGEVGALALRGAQRYR
jgi:hypothetical protein